MSIEQRRALIDPDHEQLSIGRQCDLVSISRSSFYYHMWTAPSLQVRSSG
jgi:hypothetical protein